MKHYTSSDYWKHYHELPGDIQALADKNYELLKANPRHPSLQLKRIEELWSVRRTTETLYRVAPDLDPELLDEGIGYGPIPRNASELACAEQRLADLGFQLATEGNVKSYTDERETVVVYADPRANGEISFTVYKKPLPKRGRVPRVRTWASNRFYIKDNWKNDILGKYEARVAQATKK